MVSGVTVTVTVLLSLAGLVSPGAVTVALLTIGDAPVYGLAKLTVNANALLAPLAKTATLQLTVPALFVQPSADAINDMPAGNVSVIWPAALCAGPLLVTVSV